MSEKILEEYAELTDRIHFIETELKSLPNGYLSKKTINNSVYYYLQNRKGNKVESKYLHKNEVADVEAGIKKRKDYEAEIAKIHLRIKDLEKAAKIISKDLLRKMLLIKICCGMDELSSKEKTDCAAFAVAMNAVEGVPASKETQAELSSWQNGKIPFSAVVSNVLSRYGGYQNA